MFHGYLLRRGRFTTIDVPGAVSTRALGISASGEIAGNYTDAAGKIHGFLLRAEEFTTIDLPKAIYTEAFQINPRGDIVGNYQSADGVFREFLLSGGAFTSIDFPGAVATGGTLFRCRHQPGRCNRGPVPGYEQHGGIL